MQKLSPSCSLATPQCLVPEVWDAVRDESVSLVERFGPRNHVCQRSYLVALGRLVSLNPESARLGGVEPMLTTENILVLREQLADRMRPSSLETQVLSPLRKLAEHGRGFNRKPRRPTTTTGDQPTRLPRRRRPAEGESTMSWIWRNAALLGVPNNVLLDQLGLVERSWRSYTGASVRLAPTTERAISTATGVSIDRIRDTTMASIPALADAPTDATDLASWLRHAWTRPENESALCGGCLQDQPEVFRTWWLTGFSFCCVKHQTWMDTSCRRCGYVFGGRLRKLGPVCDRCGAEDSLARHPAPANVIDAQRWLIGATSDGAGDATPVNVRSTLDLVLRTGAAGCGELLPAELQVAWQQHVDVRPPRRQLSKSLFQSPKAIAAATIIVRGLLSSDQALIDAFQSDLPETWQPQRYNLSSSFPALRTKKAAKGSRLGEIAAANVDLTTLDLRDDDLALLTARLDGMSCNEASHHFGLNSPNHAATRTMDAAKRALETIAQINPTMGVSS